MSRDWSVGAQDDFLVDPRLAHEARPAARVGRPAFDLGLPLLCVLAGAMAALVYVWPVLLIVDVMVGRFRPALFGWILAGSVGLASIVFWAVTALEARYWPRKVHSLGEFADPPPWT
jgi:hypothetical protein